MHIFPNEQLPQLCYIRKEKMKKEIHHILPICIFTLRQIRMTIKSRDFVTQFLLKKYIHTFLMTQFCIILFELILHILGVT